MRPLAALSIGAILALAHPAPAAGLKGIVLEQATGRPLARALVSLEISAAGSRATAAGVSTDRTGQFYFPNLPPGAYFVSAQRRGFARAKYGQKRRLGPGRPIRIEGDQFPFLELRLSRLGAISGFVYDENLVGLPDQRVAIYRGAKPPLELVVSATTDDRGWYRAGGLMPGKYWIRAAGGSLEDGSGILPTFFPRSTVLGEARPVEADLDRETSDINIEPIPGRVGTLEISIPGPPGPVNLTLSSDTGRRSQTMNAPGTARFEGLPPSTYELLAEMPNPAIPPFVPYSGHLLRFLDRDERITVELKQNSSLALVVQGGEAVLSLRRKDLAGEGQEQPAARQMPLGAGTWEVLARPAADSYYVSLSASNAFRGRRRDEAGHEIELLANSSYIRAEVTVSAKSASLSGMVKLRGEPVAAAPVFLYPVDEGLRKRLNGPRAVWTGDNGRYRFSGLAPGDYLVLSTLEFEDPTEEMLTGAKARTAQLKESDTETLDLELYELL